jgi:hypothetical protein
VTVEKDSQSFRLVIRFTNPHHESPPPCCKWRPSIRTRRYAIDTRKKEGHSSATRLPNYENALGTFSSLTITNYTFVTTNTSFIKSIMPIESTRLLSFSCVLDLGSVGRALNLCQPHRTVPRSFGAAPTTHTVCLIYRMVYRDSFESSATER